MTDAVDVTEACPFLGLPGDPQTHYSVPEPSQLCRAMKKAARIDLAHQASFCLGADYAACDRYKQRTEPLPTVPNATPIAAADGLAAPLEGTQPLHGRRSRGLLVAALVALLFLAALGVVLGLGWRAPGPSAVALSPSATLAAAALGPSPEDSSVVQPPTQAPTSSPTASPAATAAVTPAPTSSPAPTPSPSAGPTPMQTSAPISYTVKNGDTLGQIARLFGVTPASIVLLNGIHDPNDIEVGWVLLIPVQ